jgi:hypothetical protein
LRQADPLQARWPRFIGSSGATIDPPLDELGAGAYQLVRVDRDTAGPMIGSPVWLAGDYGHNEERLVGMQWGRPPSVWVGLHTSFLHRFDERTAEPIHSVLVGNHIGGLLADDTAVYAEVESSIVRIDADTGTITESDPGEGLALFKGRLATVRDEHLQILAARTLETLHSLPIPGAWHEISVDDGTFHVKAHHYASDRDSLPPPPDHWQVTLDGDARRTTA